MKAWAERQIAEATEECRRFLRKAEALARLSIAHGKDLRAVMRASCDAANALKAWRDAI